MLARIVSGGQTGVDRGALDAALAVAFPCGGWCPEGRKAEDGVIPDRYPLLVLHGAGYRQRTRRNVEDSDGTLILVDGALSGGTKRTRDLCQHERKPLLVLVVCAFSVEAAARATLCFIADNAIARMNVAGPRASGWPEGYRFAVDVVGEIIARVRRAKRAVDAARYPSSRSWTSLHIKSS